MTVQKIESKKQFDELLDSGKVVFIDFYADWCGPCKMISPEFERLAGEHTKEGVEFYKADIEQLPEIAVEVGIQSIPAFYAYKNKERLDKFVGANRSALTTFVQAGLTRV